MRQDPFSSRASGTENQDFTQDSWISQPLSEPTGCEESELDHSEKQSRHATAMISDMASLDADLEEDTGDRFFPLPNRRSTTNEVRASRLVTRGLRQGQQLLQSARSWSGTIFPDTTSEMSIENQYAEIQRLLDPITSKLVMGAEISPTTGKPHCQLALVSLKTIRRTGLKVLLGTGDLPPQVASGSHWEMSRGSWDQNVRYCSKERALYLKEGNPSSDRTKREKQEEAAMVFQSTGETQLLMEAHGAHWMMMNAQRLSVSRAALAVLTSPVKECAPVVVWCYGSTGTRKSTFARQYATCTNRPIWVSPPSSSAKQDKIWYHNYVGQEIAVLDDVRSESLPLVTFLRLADRLDASVEIKGGFALFAPKILFVTAPVAPLEFFSAREKPSEVAQALRRVTAIFEFKMKSKSRGDQIALPEYAEEADAVAFMMKLSEVEDIEYERRCVVCVPGHSVDQDELGKFKVYANLT